MPLAKAAPSGSPPATGTNERSRWYIGPELSFQALIGLVRLPYEAAHGLPDIRPPKSRKIGFLQEILTDDYPVGNRDRRFCRQKQSALFRLQVRFNKLKNIGPPYIRATPAETVTFLRARTESGVSFGFHGSTRLPDFLTQDAVGR